jgi:hypothetical protein
LFGGSEEAQEEEEELVWETQPRKISG